MISHHYFYIQKLGFMGTGINIMTKGQNGKIEMPVLLIGLMLSALVHFIITLHYVYQNIRDFIEVTDAIPFMGQLLLSIWKMLIFLGKRNQILPLINKIHEMNVKAKNQELAIVRRENKKDQFLCFMYLRLVIITGSFGLIHPLVYGLYMFLTSGQLVLNEPNKASYFWEHSSLVGYSLVFLFNTISMYFTCVVSLGTDTLFSWFVSNIVAQFHIIVYRFEQAAKKCAQTSLGQQEKPDSPDRYFEEAIECHQQTLQLADKFNQVYGEIVFIKFLVVCSEICCLVYRVGRPNDSMADVAYKCLFLSAIALQLILYCYNGQRIKDESLQVSTEIYCAFDWSYLSVSHKKVLLQSIMRSQISSYVKGVFFEVDLTLYLWVFRTAGSLITALMTLDEKQG